MPADPDAESPDVRAPRVSVINLGCAKNTVDTETALGALIEAGFELAPDPADADLILINTCGFIEAARDEARGVIKEMLSLKEEDGWPKIAAMGCFAERAAKELVKDYPALDAVWGLGIYTDLSERCLHLLRRTKTAPHVHGQATGKHIHPIATGPRLVISAPSYAYLRISEGCNNRCSYCAIPSIRGPLRSRPAEDILEEAKHLVGDAGIRELILVAQDTTAYGMDQCGTSQLPHLLESLLRETDAPRIRILYAHPAHLCDGVIDLLGAEPRLCGYLDLPVQHIDDAILKQMNRPYNSTTLLERLESLRTSVPDLVLRTSVIVGFPGEDEAAFARLLAFVEAGHAQHLGCFTYSQEKGTAASYFDHSVPADIAASRRDAILQAQAQVAFAWQDARLGQTVDLLLDAQENETGWLGRSTAEAPEVDSLIRITGTNFYLGQIIPACLKSRDGYDMVAVAIS